MVSKRLTNYFYCFFIVFNFLFFWNVSWFCSARAFCDIYVVVIENSYEVWRSVSDFIQIPEARTRSKTYWFK